jgi:hypothetical protein
VLVLGALSTGRAPSTEHPAPSTQHPAPSTALLEDNTNARRFYERVGGVVAERQIVDFTAGIATPALRYVWDPL